jgi:glucose/arabinose dehydrogenase
MHKGWIALFVLCLVVPRNAGAQLQSRVYASGFSLPLAFVQDPADRRIQYVVQQGGRIRVVKDGIVQPTDFLNLTTSISSGGERGLLGLAFPQSYATSGRFYVNFTNTNGDTVVARFRRSSDPLVADASSRFDLRLGGQAIIVQPYANHNGGNLVFGPDGFLYIGMGDGGSGDDPEHRAQDPSQLLGKLLRVDVNVPDTNTAGFVVPPDNPFVGGAPAGVRPEIWAFGLRNPWRFSFDDPARGGTGAILIADVGQSRYEEVDYEPARRGGRNYGWRNREGAHDNVTSRPVAYQPVTEPIFEYDHSQGVSITGGYVYRGNGLGNGFRGRYFFADFTGRVWSIALSVNGAGEGAASDLQEHTNALGGSGALGNISSFGVDADGEIYIVNYASGVVIKMLGTLTPPSAPTGLRIIP